MSGRWLGVCVVSIALGCRPPSPVMAPPPPHAVIVTAPPPSAPIVLRDWLSAQGATASLDDLGNECCCVELAVGPAHEPAAQCDELEDLPVDEAYWVVVHRIVRVVRAGAIVTVLDLPVQLGDMDRLPRRGEPWADLELALTIAPDGTSATLDGAAAACTAPTGDPKGADARDTAIRRMCAARGVYGWSGAGFVRLRGAGRI